MRLGMIFLRSLEAFGDLPKSFWVVLRESGKGLGRLGQAMEPLNCVLDASWERLRGFRRRLEANLRRLRGFRKPFEGAKGRPRPRFKSVRGCFCSVFWCSFEVASKN